MPLVFTRMSKLLLAPAARVALPVAGVTVGLARPLSALRTLVMGKVAGLLPRLVMAAVTVMVLLGAA